MPVYSDGRRFYGLGEIVTKSVGGGLVESCGVHQHPDKTRAAIWIQFLQVDIDINELVNFFHVRPP